MRCPINASPIRLLFLMACALCLQFRTATAQSMSNDEFIQHLSETTNKTVDDLVDAFRPHIPEANRYLLDKDNINVTPFADFNAYSDTSSGQIGIHFGLVLEMHLQAHAYIYTQTHPASAKNYNDYLRYLAKRSHRAAVAFKNGASVDDEPIKNFWAFCDMPEPGELSETDAESLTKIMVDALALVLGHELSGTWSSNTSPTVQRVRTGSKGRTSG